MIRSLDQFERTCGMKAVALTMLWGGAMTVSGNDFDKAMAKMAVTADQGAELQLEVRQMPLVKVLETIRRETHIPIHYSVLPDGLISATCVGSALTSVLNCLLNRKADFVVRYDRSTRHLAEVWILGSRLDDGPYEQVCTQPKEGSIRLQNPRRGNGEPDQTNDLLKQAGSERAEQRAEAIGALLGTGRPGDPKVKAALEDALTDSDASVRAQAISTYVRREGKAALGALRTALTDDAVDVRMMAVDAISDDTDLLQQALNDGDETVRDLAAMKLEELARRNQAPPSFDDDHRP